jgi:hypothetical protein
MSGSRSPRADTPPPSRKANEQESESDAHYQL